MYAPIPVLKEDDTIDILVFEDDAARANPVSYTHLDVYKRQSEKSTAPFT